LSHAFLARPAPRMEFTVRKQSEDERRAGRGAPRRRWPGSLPESLDVEVRITRLA